MIDLVLGHPQIKKEQSFILNYIVATFEKNPTENAKYIVKLILDLGMDPNSLRQLHLKKEFKAAKEDKLPEKILAESPIALACMKY